MKTEDKDLIVMKLLHYFITEKNYNPVVVHGIQNEIWLENMDSDFRIVRIVLNYIHNKEQLDFDNFKVSKLSKQIKQKTFTFSMKVLSLYLDVNEDLKAFDNKINTMIMVRKESDITNNQIINNTFSDISEKLKFTEEGQMLYQKINNDILRKNIDTSEKMNELFSDKKPIVTYVLIGVMTIIMISMYIFGNGSDDIETLYNFGALVKNGNPIRLITSIFLHIGLFHFLANMYSLKILGETTERFYGHFKTIVIFLYSGIIGNLLSVVLMNENVISAGASGSIFGLMGALLYFSLNQRTYMSEALRKQIIPIIILNLFLGFTLSGINMFAHIGGLIGGILISMALGIKYKENKTEKINGIICSVLLAGILIYLSYFM